MSHVRFSIEQQAILRQNSNVMRCSDRAITYSKDFKVRAAQQHKEGLSPAHIFAHAGFPAALIPSQKAANLIHAWSLKQKTFGDDGLLHETRGRLGGRPKMRTKPTDRNSKEYVKWLEMELAFILELRAVKTERQTGKKKRSKR